MSPRTHLRGSTVVLRTGELQRSLCGLWLDLEPVQLAKPGELPTCSRCLFLADEAPREARP